MESPRVAVVTGAGRGLGRAHAIELARHGHRVVVNDLGATADGSTVEGSPAHEVVETIRSSGGEAVANGDDIADSAGAQRVIETALEAFGRIDVLVNNAGIIRDRMLVNLTDDDWDSVVRVHLRGTFMPLRAAARHWRERSKAGHRNDARVINTTSGSGLYGNVGQSNYAAAKAAIASLTVIAASELRQYGVAVNAIAPGARTRMTENPNRKHPSPFAFDEEAAFDVGAPENISGVVAWLASAGAAGVTGKVLNISGGSLSVADGWRAGEVLQRDARWTPDALDEVMPRLLDVAQGPMNMSGLPASAGSGH